MLCKIADLVTEVPEAVALSHRFGDYRCDEALPPDLVIREEEYREGVWNGASRDIYEYMESGAQFYVKLLFHEGMMLHASAVAYEGQAYLFSGPSGTGKSTHTKLWQSIFGEKAQVFNDDKPALRRIDGCWYAYGTPWCGKDGINRNMKAPIAGICLLKQAPENRIRRLSIQEAIPEIIFQTHRRFRDEERRERMLSCVGKLITEVPIFRFENTPTTEAAWLSYRTMSEAARRDRS